MKADPLMKTDIEELREVFVDFLASGDELGVAIHPMLVEHVTLMAKILGVDPELIPTERKLFLGQ